LSEPTTYDTKDAENVFKVFLYNKVNVDERDDSDYIRTEIHSLIDRISNSSGSMCERRKDIVIGILYGGDVYAELKVIQLLTDVFESYILGKYYATVAVASMAAERLCYDFIEILDIKFGERTLTKEDKEELTYIQFNKLLSFLKKIGVLSDSDVSLLFQINEIRNRHIHPKMKDVEKDATKIVKLLCELLEGRLSMFKFYDLVDGRFVLKSNMRNT
jgi:hypothetical protein